MYVLCLYIEAIAELKSHLGKKMSSWYFFCRYKAPAWSLQAQLGLGEGAPSLFPHPQLRKWHRPLPPVTQMKHQKGQKGEAAKRRAPEPPVFTHLSLARASMKIWCIFKSYTAIKWRENASASAFRVPLIERDCGVSEQTSIKWDIFLTFRILL